MTDQENKSRSQPSSSGEETTAPAKKKRKADDHSSMVDIEIPNADLIAPFQITDGNELLASSRKVTPNQHPIRPSYAEGLQAINSEDLPQDMRDRLQLDHSKEYMERKFREWQAQNPDSAVDLEQFSAAASVETAVDREQFPYYGKEFTQLSKCSQASSKAWKNAYHAFPKLQGTFEYKQAVTLMKALVLNELQNYRAKYVKRDQAAQMRHIPHTSLEPLGFSQMTPKMVRELELGLTGGKNVRPPFSQLTSFFGARGYSGQGHEASALLDPNCVPVIVAAKLEALIEHYERGTDRFSAKPLIINVHTLAYGYKPDVFFNPKDPGDPDFHVVSSPDQAFEERLRGLELLYPCTQKNILRHSHQMQSVRNWISRLNEPM